MTPLQLRAERDRQNPRRLRRAIAATRRWRTMWDSLAERTRQQRAEDRLYEAFGPTWPDWVAQLGGPTPAVVFVADGDHCDGAQIHVDGWGRVHAVEQLVSVWTYRDFAACATPVRNIPAVGDRMSPGMTRFLRGLL